LFFDKFATTFDTFYEGKRSRWMRFIDGTFRRDMYLRFALTFEKLGNLTDATVSDIGCGSGVYVMETLRRGAAHVAAVDPAPAMLALLCQRLREAGQESRCTTYAGAFPAVKPPPGDFAIVMGVMDYIQDAPAFLEQLRPLVRQAAAVSFPSRHWLRTPLRSIRYKFRRCPVYFYDEPQIRALCQQAGFGSIDVYKIPGAGMDYHVVARP
jgi:cyclopropane fatty-acyl-phospholipid synthase-like methyltransferase